jgi:hypothetical protein
MAADQPAKTALPATLDDAGTRFVYFDAAPNYANISGIISVTLCAARRRTDGNGGINIEFVAVADLRCSIEAATHLRDALNGALLLGMPTKGEAN